MLNMENAAKLLISVVKSNFTWNFNMNRLRLQRSILMITHNFLVLIFEYT